MFLQEFVGSEWAVFKLGVSGIISAIVVDTNHFKGNFPDSISIEGKELEPETSTSLEMPETWSIQVLEPQKLGPHCDHFFVAEIKPHRKLSHVRVTIKPDGGVSRIRLLGHV